MTICFFTVPYLDAKGEIKNNPINCINTINASLSIIILSMKPVMLM